MYHILSELIVVVMIIIQTIIIIMIMIITKVCVYIYIYIYIYLRRRGLANSFRFDGKQTTHDMFACISCLFLSMSFLQEGLRIVGGFYLSVELKKRESLKGCGLLFQGWTTQQRELERLPIFVSTSSMRFRHLSRFCMFRHLSHSLLVEHAF